MKIQLERQAAGRREQIATRLTFLLAGAGMAAWAPLVPYAKERLGADNGMLGILLLCLGLGSMAAMPISGILANRYGCRAIIVTAAIGIAISLPILGYVSTPLQLALVLILFGCSVGAVDVAVNIQAVIVEKDSGRSMMSGFHGLWSLGGIVGAGGVSLLLKQQFSLIATTVLVSIVILLLVAVAYRGLLTYGSTESSDAGTFVWPKAVVVALGLLCFFVFLAEGAILDWSAVFLVSNHGYEQASAGAAYASFAITMTIGRLLGDRVVSRLGGQRVVAIGGVLAALGFIVAIFASQPIIVLAGFALVGAGLSNIAPVFFTAAGNQSVMPSNLAVSAVFTLGYAGILLGPAVIGFIGQMWGLSVAFLLIAASMCLISFIGPLFARPQ